jgi:hypothetical protein
VDKLVDTTLGVNGRHWLVTFAAGKYAPVRNVIKETNLFFVAEVLLRLFPDSPMVVASRSPLGVVGSFHRGNLFTRWHYSDRYRQLQAMTASPQWRRWARVLPHDEPDETTMLVRLIVLNTLLLAEATYCPEEIGRPLLHVPFQRAALNQGGPLAAIGRLIGTELTRAEAWPAGDHLYKVAPSRAPRLRNLDIVSAVDPVVAYIARGRVSWRNLLVSNAEYAALLNGLLEAGLENTVRGTHLLAIPMPAERGGRLYSEHGRWRVQWGYERHPVYWVTWIGAATFAAATGARLPTRSELDELTAELPTGGINAAYRIGDVTSGASRGIGIRLVRDGVQRTTSIDQLVSRLSGWIGSLADRHRPLHELDAPLLAGLQADIGLRADVRPGIREP